MGAERSQPDLDHLFHPRTIAVVGVSRNGDKFGGSSWVRALQELGFRGPIYPVNPRLTQFGSLTVYPSVGHIPDSIDLVIASIPARFAPRLMEECAAKRAKFVHFYTAGFTETGDAEGRTLEQRLTATASATGVRIIGPNCMGVYCPGAGISWRLDFPREAGSVAVLSQSGLNAAELVNFGKTRGIRFSKLISFGNACDLKATDFLDYFARDAESTIIAAYLEGMEDGATFLRTLAKTARIKPVIVLKGGQTPSGVRAAASHTASLAGRAPLWDVALRQAGALRVSSMDEMIDTLVGFACLPVPNSSRVAVIGSGGGRSVLAADDCEAAGLALPSMPDHVQKELGHLMPREGSSFANPIDAPIGWTADPGQIGRLQEAVKAVAAVPDIGALILYAGIDNALCFMGRAALGQMNEATIRAVRECGKPVAVSLHSSGSLEAARATAEEQQRFVEAGIPVYPTILRAAHAIRKLLCYHGIE